MDSNLNVIAADMTELTLHSMIIKKKTVMIHC